MSYWPSTRVDIHPRTAPISAPAIRPAIGANGPLDILSTNRSVNGTSIRWNGGEGVAAGINDDGALVVETDSGRVALNAGEVHLQRTP